MLDTTLTNLTGGDLLCLYLLAQMFGLFISLVVGAVMAFIKTIFF